MLAQVLLQGVVQNVRGRVGPANALPAAGVDAGRHRGALLELALAQMAAGAA